MIRKHNSWTRSVYISVTAAVASIILAMPVYGADDDDR